ncbi:hypothetical protein GCM10011309_17010 [Litorimonas cladophorae]|uniref:Uncharacterized protein n=1 Tax=Litorimonas cladophorae TaxID=1220491 RepID=A0A918KN12_9PROT|nr:hypothetical protein GCM10011309_17010 [Litorimonas cladophorae]
MKRTVFIGLLLGVFLCGFLYYSPEVQGHQECIILDDKVVLNFYCGETLHYSMSLAGKNVTIWGRGKIKPESYTYRTLNKYRGPRDKNGLLDLRVSSDTEGFFVSAYVTPECYDAALVVGANS